MVAFDVVEDILLRSDAKDLLRCKSVCKSWYSLISTPRFVQAHLKKSAASKNDIRICMPAFWKTGNLYQLNQWRVVGSSNGLVCVSRIMKDGFLLVNNPLTREVTSLPMAPISPKCFTDVSLSFGYDAYSDDYKVVMGSKENYNQTFFQVLSLKSNTWKTLGRFNYTLFHNQSGIMFNGCFYWIAFDCTLNANNVDSWDNQKRIILSFDLSREVFTAVPEPNDPSYSSGRISLGITDNQLRLYISSYEEDDDDDNDLPDDIWVKRRPSKLNDFPDEIWVMRSHDSWERLPDDCETTYQVVHFMSMLDFSSPMYNHQQRINFFFADNKCLPKPWIRYTNAHMFTPSLVSPYVNSGRPSHSTDSNTFANAWSVEVPKAESLQPTKSKFFKASELIQKTYRQDVGEADNFYPHDDGELATLCLESGDGGENKQHTPREKKSDN